MKNFVDSAEFARWKARCTRQRYIAAKHPCEDPAKATCTDFETTVGPWNLRLVLETFVQPPIWHASVSYFKHIGDEVVLDKKLGLPIFEAPQDALLLVKDWDHEELDIARSLLGDLLGPLIPTEDTHVREDRRFFAMHWVLDAREVARRIAERN